MARLTKDVRQRLLESNEGFSTRTFYEGRNSREERIYTISGGQLHIRAIGKTSWADSRYEDEWIGRTMKCTDFCTHINTKWILAR